MKIIYSYIYYYNTLQLLNKLSGIKFVNFWRINLPNMTGHIQAIRRSLTASAPIK